MAIENRKWIKEGMEVAHKELIDGTVPKKMFVERILKKKKTFDTGEKDKNGNPIIKKVTWTLGVKCHWMEGNKWMHKKFHTRELVPYDVAIKGKEAIIEFLEN